VPTNYKEIAEVNIKKYGTDIVRYGPVLLAQLYSDRTHFIYEILQNAEDAGAKEIYFYLFNDRLEVRHNGRLFNNDDVRGICGLVEGTKKDNLTQIGRFGIGFKSVYAYTNTPKIYSGGEAFYIKNYVLPNAINETDIKNNETLFVFPFDHAEVFTEQAFKEIAKRLRDIGTRTLLFLNHIQEIFWRIDKEESGNYIRDVKTKDGHKKVYIISKVAEQNVVDEEWLVFERPFKLKEYDTTNLKVEVAFKIKKDKNDKEIIVPAKDSKLIVFFPTERPTYLNFLIQGPYKTTPNRENIPLDDELNKIIVKETGELIAESIPLIKELGYLDVHFLNVLPLDSAHIEEEPIYAAVFERVKTMLLSDEELLPTHEGRYTKASDVLLARGKDLTEILDQKDIVLLFSRRNWLSTNITYDLTRKLRDYLIEELEIKEIDFKDFVRQITLDFIEAKSDDWIVRFYNELLNNHSALWSRNESILRKKPIIRLENGTHKEPYDSDGIIQVHLPIQTKSGYNTIKKTIVENSGALDFCKKLGLDYPNVFTEIIEKILPKYKKGNNIENTEYFEDFDKVISFFTKCDSKSNRETLIKTLSSTYFILSTEQARKLPSEIYQNIPDLIAYFDGFDSACFVSNELNSKFFDKNLSKFLKAIGVQDVPRREKFDISLSEETKSILRNDRPVTYDINQYDYVLEGLEVFLSQDVNIERSHLLWKLLLKSINLLPQWHAEQFFEGNYEWMRHSHRNKHFDAKFVMKLQQTSWLVNKNGDLVKPSEVTILELADNYSKDAPNINVLKEKLRLKPDAFDQLPDDLKNKLELFKDLSLNETKKALTLLKASDKPTEESANEDWTPECDIDDVDVIIEEPHPLAIVPPQFEGQTELLIINKDGEDSPKKKLAEKTQNKINTKQSKQIGDWGEEFVLKALKKKFDNESCIEDTEFGFQLKNKKGEFIEVYWLNRASTLGKGCDFIIKKNHVENEYIEVKSKLHEERQLIEITGKQWEFARKLHDRNKGYKYWIYTVINAGTTNAKIRKISDPIKLWKDGKLYAHPVQFEL